MKTDRQALREIETLLEQFLNRAAKPNEELVLLALGIASQVLSRPSVEEQRALEDSWLANPDRMGGAFTDDEIAARGEWH